MGNTYFRVAHKNTDSVAVVKEGGNVVSPTERHIISAGHGISATYSLQLEGRRYITWNGFYHRVHWVIAEMKEL